MILQESVPPLLSTESRADGYQPNDLAAAFEILWVHHHQSELLKQ
jgi:hypothetical protein